MLLQMDLRMRHVEDILKGVHILHMHMHMSGMHMHMHMHMHMQPEAQTQTQNPKPKTQTQTQPQTQPRPYTRREPPQEGRRPAAQSRLRGAAWPRLG